MHKYKSVSAFILIIILSVLGLGCSMAKDSVPRAAQDEPTWNLEMINLGDSWEITRGDQNIMVAIIGWGVDRDNPYLGGRVAHSWDYVTSSEDISDPTGHDTFAAGIVLSIAPEVSLMALRVMDGEGRDVGRLHSAITYAADHGADIILLPIALTEIPQNKYIDQVQGSILYAYSKNVRFVIGAQGRGVHHGYRFPGYLRGVYNVSGLDRQGNFSDQSTANDLNFIAAPCEEIPGIETRGDWQNIGGTSWSSSHLAGVAALMLSANPLLYNDEIEGILIETAQDRGIFGKDIYFGHGIIDSYQSVKASRDLLFYNLMLETLDYKSHPYKNDLNLYLGR